MGGAKRKNKERENTLENYYRNIFSLIHKKNRWDDSHKSSTYFPRSYNVEKNI